MAIIKVGKKAPDFTLKDHNDKDFKLKDYKGKRVLLSFHPLAWTSICAKQMKSLEKNTKKFDELDTTAVGVSVDTIPSKKAWAKELGIKKTRLLSDFWPHGKITEKFGIFNEKLGFSKRANIIIDENGKVIFSKKYRGSEVPDIKEIIGFLSR